MEIKIECRVCRNFKTIKLNEQQTVNFKKWKNREMLIQNALPELSIDDRELLISHTCGECFKKMFGE